MDGRVLVGLADVKEAGLELVWDVDHIVAGITEPVDSGKREEESGRWGSSWRTSEDLIHVCAASAAGSRPHEAIPPLRSS